MRLVSYKHREPARSIASWVTHPRIQIKRKEDSTQSWVWRGETFGTNKSRSTHERNCSDLYRGKQDPRQHVFVLSHVYRRVTKTPIPA